MATRLGVFEVLRKAEETNDVDALNTLLEDARFSVGTPDQCKGAQIIISSKIQKLKRID